jgi:adenylate kinase family enzyme
MIIGLLGFIGSGKGTVGDILVENTFTPLSFAGSLKDAVSSIFSWDRALLEGDTEESRVFRETVDDFWSVKFGKPITPRYILQYFGTEVCRENLLDNIWVHSLERKIQQHENVVVTDVRFKNEISFLKSIGAVFVQIDRKETRPEWFDFLDFLDPSTFEAYANSQQIHKSEYDWYAHPLIDYRIENNGTLQELELKVLDVIVNN